MMYKISDRIIRISIIFSWCLLLACSSKKEQIQIQKISSVSSVSVTVDLASKGVYIPDNFTGLSFETGSLRSGNAGVNGNFFTAANKQVLTLFRQMGIRSLRIGGGSVDLNSVAPTNSDIDALFEFVKAADLKVIYTLRLLNGDASENVSIAKYIWDHYRQYLDDFEIGNEPDWNYYHNKDPEITDYPSYLAKWRKFAAAITAVIPDARFSGPNTGSNYPIQGALNTNYNGRSWTVNFADDVKSSGIVSVITQHNYVGQNAPDNTAQEMINKMLWTGWDTIYYPALYKNNLEPVLAKGFPYRLAESNSFSGEVDGGSNSFATALFALDYMHWWAGHNCQGINFHNKQWVKNAPIFRDSNGDFNVYPIAYGIKAFDIGGHGYTHPVLVSNPDGLNLTAYAVKNDKNAFVTIINKTYAASARDADVTINSAGLPSGAAVMFLKTSQGDVSATSGVTLGNVPINNIDSPQEQWTNIDLVKSGQCRLTVPASSAAIVKFY